MKYALRLEITACLICTAFMFAQSTPSSNIHSYRYELSTRSGDPKFVGEISSTAPMGGKRYEVETDAEGRAIRVTVVLNGQKLSQRRYHFVADAKLPNGYDRSVAGEGVGVVRIQRDEEGKRSREDYFTVDGTLTRYDLYTYSPDHVEQAQYTAKGKKRRYDDRYYSARDILIREISYDTADPTNYSENGFEEGTGLLRSHRQLKDGKLYNTGFFTYDADDELVRSDGYDGKRRWYTGDEFKDGLRMKRIYVVGGARRELQYTYDEKRWLKESVLSYEGGFVCKFLYDRLPDGTVTRTRALGPNDELWAEYPDNQVTDVNIGGKALSGESVIHKTGNWWKQSFMMIDKSGIEILADTLGVDFGPYMQGVVNVIRKNWYNAIPESAFRQKGHVAIEFAITKEGKIAGMKLVAVSGNVPLDRAAWAGITASNPLPPLPPEFSGSFLALRMHFEYNPDRSHSTSITLSPAAPRILTGVQQQFSATVSGAADSKVYWSIWGDGCATSSCGSISADGVYTAPSNLPNPAILTVMATLAADPTETDSATVRIESNKPQ
jgi:TonB family protein